MTLKHIVLACMVVFSIGLLNGRAEANNECIVSSQSCEYGPTDPPPPPPPPPPRPPTRQNCDHGYTWSHEYQQCLADPYEDDTNEPGIGRCDSEVGPCRGLRGPLISFRIVRWW